MSKLIFQIEMAAALEAAAIHAALLDAFLLESKKSGEPTRELNIKIRQAEENWMLEIEKHHDAHVAYLEY